MKTQADIVRTATESMRASGVERLLLAGCGQERVAKPVGSRLAGSPDSRRDGLRFFGAQAHRENLAARILLRQSRASHFFGHSKRLSEYKKLLTAIYFAFTKRQV